MTSALEALELREDKERVKEIVAEELVGRLNYLSQELIRSGNSFPINQLNDLLEIVNDFINHGSVPTIGDLASKLARIAIDIEQDFVHQDEVLRLAKMISEFDEKHR